MPKSRHIVKAIKTDREDRTKSPLDQQALEPAKAAATAKRLIKVNPALFKRLS